VSADRQSMSLIERYVFRLAMGAFLAALGGLTGVIWVTQVLRDFDLLTTKGQSLIIFLMATGLVVPSLVMIIAPVALFGAIIFTLNKLNGDSELIVMSASGLSPATVLRPMAVLTVIVGLLVGFITLWAMPASFAELRDLLMHVRADFLSRVVREGQFTTLDQGFVFHYRERAPNGGLEGIFMQDRRDPDHMSTYIAEQGLTVESDKQNYLVLEKGSIQRQAANSRDPVMVVFDRYAIDLAQFGSDADGAPLKPRERSTWRLIHPKDGDTYARQYAGAMRSELHDRLVNPLYAIVFGLVAFAALATPRTTRQGRSLAVSGAVVIVLLLRVAGFGFAALLTKNASAVIPLYGLPIATMFGALWYAFGEPAKLLRRLPLPSILRLRLG
jgi:lipopolysaccharide export system permease protein